MSSELVYIAEALAGEKQIDHASVFQALEEGLSVAARRYFDNERNFRVEVDQKTGEITIYRTFKIVEEVTIPTKEISLEAAQYEDPSLQVGDVIEDLVEDNSFLQLDRITLHTTRQVMISKLREFEKEQAAQRYESRIGEIINGTVKKTTVNAIIVDLGEETEAVIHREHLLSRDRFRVGDRIKALLLEIKRGQTNKSAQIILSRTSPEFLNQLLEIEVPEIADGDIKIINTVRDPGFRSKIAVHSINPRIDAIGSCIGMRLARINAVSSELQGERIDVVLWEEDLAKYTINVLSPASINEIFIDEQNKTIEVSVDSENLAKAIGRNGQNVRLASQLICWDIKILTNEEFLGKRQQENEGPINLFIKYLGLDEGSAELLVNLGYTRIEELLGSESFDDLVETFDEDQVILIQDLALKGLEEQKAEALQILKDKKFDLSILEFDDINEQIALELVKKEILTLDDLADCSSFDFEDIENVDKSIWDSIIMQAREKVNLNNEG